MREWNGNAALQALLRGTFSFGVFVQFLCFPRCWTCPTLLNVPRFFLGYHSMVMEFSVCRRGRVFLQIFPNTSLTLHRGCTSPNRAIGIRNGFSTLVFQASTFPAARSHGIYPLLAILPLLTLSCIQPGRKRDVRGWKPSVGSWLSEKIVSVPGKHCSEWDEHLFPG